jgi:hypothetical protein
LKDITKKDEIEWTKKVTILRFLDPRHHFATSLIYVLEKSGIRQTAALFWNKDYQFSPGLMLG